MIRAPIALTFPRRAYKLFVPIQIPAPGDFMSNAATQGVEFDPVTLEIYWSRLISIADESAAALLRTSFSTIVLPDFIYSESDMRDWFRHDNMRLSSELPTQLMVDYKQR